MKSAMPPLLLACLVLWPAVLWPAAAFAQGPTVQAAPTPSATAPSVGIATTATERLYLSGTGRDDTKPWRFTINEGRRAGEETTLPVPSQWELHGFGVQNYGHDERKGREQGRYATDFRVPPSWQGRQIDLVFEGVMTDTTATINGQSVGPTHRGSFYRFRYPVTDLVRLDDLNTLEVVVDEHSADNSVNLAERDADYWVFGGIFRPVYLESRPSESIRHLAIDARHDGELAIHVKLEGLTFAATLEAYVEDARGQRKGEHSVDVSSTDGSAVIRMRISGVEPWSAENPALHYLRLRLRRGAQELHRVRQHFGFRTVELRPGEGLFVNGERVRLRGVNRHAFWPTSGRTLDADLDRRDVELMKRLNLNAVRASHYPPDPSFLDACDQLGLYVINELAGWHDAYGTSVGTQLVREMVERDVNHPSVILWANGNEGGWNTDLDDLFAQHDPSQRPVFHPDENFRGLDTRHYPTWEELEERLEPDSWLSRWRSLFGPLPPLMPTEALHGLYDGGSGAGLARYWDRIRSHPRGAGLFLWSFIDESLARDGVADPRRLDSAGNYAPDGILGPFRELTGNYYAVREVFSPIQIEADPAAARQGRVRFENRHDHRNLDTFQLRWAWVDFPTVTEATQEPPPHRGRALDQGLIAAPNVAPGDQLELTLPISAAPEAADALRLVAVDPTLDVRQEVTREVMTWVLPLRDLRDVHRNLGEAEGQQTSSSAVTAEEIDGRVVLTAGDTVVEIDPATGGLLALGPTGRASGLVNGPRPSDGPAPRAVMHSVSNAGQAGTFEAQLEGGLDRVQWTLFPNGWLRLHVGYTADPEAPYHGVRFDYHRELVKRFQWIGDGPTRQWGNRREGGTLGHWAINAHRTTPPQRPDGPKLAGYYGDVAWARLETLEGTLDVAFESPGLELGLFTPQFPEDAKEAYAEVPDGGLHLLGKLPDIGTKFLTPAEMKPAPKDEGPVRVEGAVWLRFRP